MNGILEKMVEVCNESRTILEMKILKSEGIQEGILKNS
jgi:hypothetical protein